MRIRNQQGFGHVALLVAVVAVAVIGLAGYRVWTTRTASTSSTTVSSSTKLPATISSKADLTVTSKALDQSGAQLDTNLDTAALDTDINNML